ncbi:MAG: 50S ribosomal protein L4 [Omnitrophica bacterium RIFCSPHIGHO2_02_FULL_46_11]|nr:MAG: 50S ribosomal protein L4 [Omnitrophica bacterium RIFCSPHIGHO2_02_FULL_46_11]OGW86989.1 MAG: 50S ribosomal protein L4 [Omnitrophica bacterium RIFCSPLOWO2_01_FULL_45_10b]
MSKAIVYQKDGKKAGEVELNDSVFQAPVNQRLLDLVLKAYAGNQRRGTHSTKGRAEVRGGGKKPWRQKGTGRARHSSRRSPIWRGGGVTFGPHPRDYDTDLPNTMKKAALISALSLKQKQDNVLLLEDAILGKPKTKELVGIIKALGLDKSRTLFVVNSMDENLKRASRNLQHLFSIKLARDVNAYHIQRRRKLLIEKQALSTVEQRALDETEVPEVKGAKK